jgi:hypothetical protein
MDPADLAATTAAFERGYAAADELQQYFQQHPGVPIGVDPEPHPDDWYRRPVGLGYSSPPPPVLVYEADVPGLVPHVLPTPAAFDYQAPQSVTGSTHGWGLVPGPGAGSPGPGAGSPGGGLVYMGPGDTPRRSLWQRLLGRRG